MPQKKSGGIALNRKKSFLGSVNMGILLFELAAFFYNTPKFQIVGYIMILFGSSILIIDYIGQKKLIINSNILMGSILLILIYLIAVIRFPTSTALSNFSSLLISIAVLVCFSNLDILSINEKIQRYMIGIQWIVIVIPKVFKSGINPVDGGYKSIFTTTTFMGLFSCMLVEVCVIFFLLSRKRIWIFYTAGWLYILWETKVRTAVVGIFTAFFLMVLFQWIKRIKKENLLWFGKWGLFLSLILIVVIYPQLDKFSWSEKLSHFVYLHTGKILLSGRNQIWKEAIYIIKESPILGYGLDYSQHFPVAVHNSYLNVLLQTGIVGLLFVLLFLNGFLNKMIRKNNSISRTIFIFSLVNLLMCSTEVMLLQGQIILQLIIWSLFGIGINQQLKDFQRKAAF